MLLSLVVRSSATIENESYEELVISMHVRGGRRDSSSKELQKRPCSSQTIVHFRRKGRRCCVAASNFGMKEDVVVLSSRARAARARVCLCVVSVVQKLPPKGKSENRANPSSPIKTEQRSLVCHEQEQQHAGK